MIKNKVVVAGGGVLGTQIGLMSAYWGYDVTFWLRSEGSVERTRPKIQHYSEWILHDLKEAKEFIGNPQCPYLYPRALIRDWANATPETIDRLYEQGKTNFENKVHIELDLAKALDGADLVVEAISENPAVKIDFYKKIRDLVQDQTIVVTNSSTLLPSMFAEYLAHPEKYLALHFANTIWKNNTAEVMGHPGTDKKYYDEVVEYAKQIGMYPVCLHKEQPRYVLNSLLVPFLDAAQELWANDVADPETIDKTWELATGAPAGPFKILDIVGLETVLSINNMHPDANKEGTLPNKIGKMLKAKIDAGETGVTAGKGFYDYKK